MRVCLMNDNFYRSSGAAIAIKRIAQAAKDVDYCFAGCRDDGLQEDLSWMPTGSYARFDLKTSKPIRLVAELLRFRKWFKSQRCDLVHCHHRRVSVVLQLAGVPVLYTAQLAFPNETWFRWLHPKKMTAITPSVAKNLLETTGCRPLACIGNPVQFSPVLPTYDWELVRSRAVCIARLDPVKAHTHLLKAWKILHDRGHRYQLDLVGEGSLKASLEEQIETDGIQDLIRFRGFTKNVSSMIEESLFAVLTSENEGQGIVTLEAAALGRPSLLTAVPGSIDLIPPQSQLTNGIEFGNVAKLADALEQWFAHPEKVVEEGKLFFDFLQNSSGPENIAQAYLAVYKQILVHPA